jgi:hypothetical protein
MRRFHRCLTIMLFLTSSCSFVSAQSGKIDSAKFFVEQKPFEMTLASDLKNLLGKKSKRVYQPATVTLRFADSTSISEEIRIQPRGKFRLENCYMPPLYLNFKNPTSPKCHTLGKLKLVCGCATGNDDEQLIIKEFLAYKIYNMLTPMSFRVRLVKVNYEDTKGKVKKYSQYGFLLEDVDDMASRNKCKEVEGTPYNTEGTDRRQMTLVALFEFMIGNSDWSVPNYHNIKLMRPVTDVVSLPYTVPYDLNHCGLVNASYALPPEELGIKSVTERVYRGFPRSMEELEEAIAVFKDRKEKIWSLINNCEWLNNRYKKEVINYIDEFYKIIENKNAVKNTFITNARTQ